ncbi:ABC transporter substrate-binding protein [Anaerotignum propionicum]|uniref:NMT1/THI5 like protein n=1 Tax=Anaerotignum propionicum DSM 1682 TaxID=991789 RepID=A0A0X1U8V3_ANAPI|nr:ABC transporter substrate-binding protein [Anaerotignum propionicum]AMJ41377.1 NMT1/THI5 like protein [Anaerotignum propionicum DSM 1682]SHE98172.1 NitT/TauT family transport system substrate-binding protein [[Clostridium] propionicum DSM 1682] [Anaerotignum propionicum DSM 1682]
MKKLISLLLAGCMCIGLAGCQKADVNSENPDTQSTASTSATEPVTITVGVPTAPPALPILHMIETKALGENVEIKLDVWDEPETLIGMVQDGEHDMFAFPLTVVSKLYNKGLDVRLMNVNTWGVTYFMTSDPDFDSWDDLKGKTVYIPLQSSPPDALTQYFLAEAGLEVGKDVEIIYATTPEVATLLASGEAVYGTLIEPQVTKALMGNENLRIAFSFEDEWQRVTGTDTKIPNAGFGTTQKFIDENPELVADFQNAYEESVTWANEHPEEIAALAEKYLGLKAAVIQKSLPNMGLEFKSAQDAQTELEMLYQLLYDFNPSMIGGKIADARLYYVDEK